MVHLTANAGVPMLIIQLPALAVTLPIVIAIESFVARRDSGGPEISSEAVTIANLFSTFLGFPILWVGLVALQVLQDVALEAAGMSLSSEPWIWVHAVTLQAAWLWPWEEHLHWMIPTAMLVLLVPAFFASVFVERLVHCRLLRVEFRDAKVARLVWRMNLASYVFLVLAGMALLGWAISKG
ncbi:MAG: hypothetical protein KF858_01730 [Candidatus Sumerlaeia bacterium]|nr:hypothetical protein [Candidatus Sumerlaeia bacterium]